MIVLGAALDLRRTARSVSIALALLPPLCGTVAADRVSDPRTVADTVREVSATTLEVEAYRHGGDLLLRADRVAAPAGDIQLHFRNNTEIGTTLLVYPIQDVSALVAADRSGMSTVVARSYLKDVVGSTDVTVPGGSTTLTMAAVVPGLYEISTFERVLRPDGSVYVTHDAGESVTLAITGGGGPYPSIGELSTTVTTTMRPSDYGTWLFDPDHLVVRAGRVTFILRNAMNESHDLVIAPLGDVSAFVTARLTDGRVDYAQIGATEIVSDLAPGRTGTAAIVLGPGVYVAACYMVSKRADGQLFIHADRGQRFTFRVL